MSMIRTCAECIRLAVESEWLAGAIEGAADYDERSALVDERSNEVPACWWDCEKCGAHLDRFRDGWRGLGDVTCRCGASYNSCGQRLREDWAENPAWRYDDVDDLEGYELACLAREAGAGG